MRTTRRAPALLALSVIIALAALLSINGSAAAQTVDYDADNDNYIEVKTHAQLNAIRHDLDGNGTPAQSGRNAYVAAFPSANPLGICGNLGCDGYELAADIDLDTDGDGSADSGDAYWNSGAGWDPIGASGANYTGDFKGNGYVVKNLFINRTTNFVGLFRITASTARIESLGVTGASVTTSGQYAGILAGRVDGQIVACYTTGSVTGTNAFGWIGGLTGYIHSYASIHSSYSTASVTGRRDIGGLVGQRSVIGTGSITDSYATGLVTRSGSGSSGIGGLIGSDTGTGSASVLRSYYDSSTTGCRTGGSNGCTTSAGGSGVVAKTTAQLQNPTTYTGIYANWNANLDGATGGDQPWHFGKYNEYPKLIYGTTVDYDADDDGYIEIENLSQLNVVRRDLNGNGDATNSDYIAAFPRRDSNAATRMGCPSGTCVGYELTANLEFDRDSDGDVDANDNHGAYWSSSAGWTPIGSHSTRYTGNFNGNGYTINNLDINGSNSVRGLFGGIGGRVESLGVTNANVTATSFSGILTATLGGAGEIVACYTTGSISGSGSSTSIGGLVGLMQAGSVSTSYSHASVSGLHQVGGLVGDLTSGSITNSYSSGAVSGGGANVRGLLGRGANGTVTASYWDTTTSGRTTSAGGSGAVGRTTTQLQTPTGYTGIYADWNLDLDNYQTGGDYPWNFGTSSQYPTLIWGKAASRDYDADNDNYIDIANHAQLNAVRRDLDGNGAPASGGATAYAAAFPNAASGMGCAATCTGYELTESIDLDTDGDGSIGTDTGDAYYNGGAGWEPIGANTSAATRYSGDFKGNGHTINNLFINRTTNYMGLFGSIHSTARIETLGVTNADVTGGSFTGVLAGAVHGAVVACYTTGAVTGNHYVGGLVGFTGVGASSASVRSSYSTAYTVGSTNIGGVIGRLAGGSMSHVYATGRVARKSDSTSGSLGGIAGASNQSVTASYYDTSTTGCVTGGSPGCTDGDGGNSIAGIMGKTARELQTVTSYTGIFANWNANLDGQTGNDDPWDFGNGMQYPMLDYDGMSTDPQGGLAMGIPDNWNAPIVGERVGVCIAPGSGATRATVSGQSYKKAWIWEKSANGDTWGAVSGSIRNPTYEYNPVAADVGSYLRAKVELTDGSFAYTRVLGGRVKETSAATAGSAITFYSGNASPQVGTIIIANDPRPSGAVDARFSWQRCDNSDATYTDCEYIPRVWWNNYTPVAADLNHYLRIVVYYETSAGVWTRHASAFTGQVAAASQ